MLLLSDADYSVWKAVKIAAVTVRAAGVRSSHVKGTIAFARPDLMNHVDAVDVADAIRAVQTTDIAGSLAPANKTPDWGLRSGGHRSGRA
jgi:hypothetical protein